MLEFSFRELRSVSIQDSGSTVAGESSKPRERPASVHAVGSSRTLPGQ